MFYWWGQQRSKRTYTNSTQIINKVIVQAHNRQNDLCPSIYINRFWRKSPMFFRFLFAFSLCFSGVTRYKWLVPPVHSYSYINNGIEGMEWIYWELLKEYTINLVQWIGLDWIGKALHTPIGFQFFDALKTNK